MDGIVALDLGLPEPDPGWWLVTVETEHAGPDKPWPPLCCPPGVVAVHEADLSVAKLKVRAGSRSAAVGVAELLGLPVTGSVVTVREASGG